MEEPKQVQVTLKMPNYMVEAIAEAASRQHVEFADIVFSACAVALATLLPGEWLIGPEAQKAMKANKDGTRIIPIRRSTS